LGRVVTVLILVQINRHTNTEVKMLKWIKEKVKLFAQKTPVQ